MKCYRHVGLSRKLFLVNTQETAIRRNGLRTKTNEVLRRLYKIRQQSAGALLTRLLGDSPRGPRGTAREKAKSGVSHVPRNTRKACFQH